MPTNHTTHFPKPTDADEFEKMCLAAAENRWNNRNQTRHGRRGQSQDGVDVYGPDDAGQLVGIQCKNTIHGISASVVDSEITKAEKFNPPLSALYIATTADTDNTLQQHVRVTSSARQALGKFPVHILFWENVVRDLSRNNQTLQSFYPQFYSNSQNPTTTPRERDIKQLKKFLNVVDLADVPEFFAISPKYIAMAFIEHEQEMLNVIQNAVFALTDTTLHNQIIDYVDAWREFASLIRSAPYDGHSSGRCIYFPMPGDAVEPRHAKIYSDLEYAVPAFLKAHQQFCHYLSQNYPEVDLDATSLQARSLYTRRPYY
jgi:hypothetical protein